MQWYLGAVLFSLFLFDSIFGLPVLLSHPQHDVGCPLHAAAAVMCESTILEHFSMWESMFASVIASLGIFLAFVLIAYADWLLLERARVRLRYRTRAPVRPTLFEELYSDGIHNRKEPYAN